MQGFSSILLRSAVLRAGLRRKEMIFSQLTQRLSLSSQARLGNALG
jgi:hypothetical protein